MKHPAFALVYGPLKVGKTAAAIAAFPNAFFIAAPGALGAAVGLLGCEYPESQDLRTFSEATAYVDKLPPGKKPALVADDVSIMCDHSLAEIQKKPPRTNKGYVDHHAVWRLLLQQAVGLGNACRRAGMHCVMTSHELPPSKSDDGMRFKGGPAFPGQTHKKLPALVDFLLHVAPRAGAGLDGSGVPFGWPYQVSTLTDDDWIAGSRYDTPDGAPFNLREILNLAGWKLPRLRGLEWQEPIADILAQKVIETIGEDDHADRMRRHFEAARRACTSKNRNPLHIEWAIADGYDRGLLKIAAQTYRSRLHR